MTPHISGTSLSAQARYAAGTREILECYFAGGPIRDEYLIVDGGALAGAGAHSYSEGNATAARRRRRASRAEAMKVAGARHGRAPAGRRASCSPATGSRRSRVGSALAASATCGERVHASRPPHHFVAAAQRVLVVRGAGAGSPSFRRLA